jgi:hypothetical protein
MAGRRNRLSPTSYCPLQFQRLKAATRSKLFARKAKGLDPEAGAKTDSVSARRSHFIVDLGHLGREGPASKAGAHSGRFSVR